MAKLECPKEFNSTLKKMWKYYSTAEFADRFQKEDLQVFKQFIISSYQYNLLADQFRIDGYNVTIKDKHGFPVVNPILKPMRDIEKRVSALANELGFSPTARKKLYKKLESSKKETEMDLDSVMGDILCD